jgi:acetyl-CoA C-acetyltransferase
MAEPVLVGVGVATQREDDPRRAMDPLALMTHAARRAGEDAGAPDLSRSLDRIMVPKGRWEHSDPGREIAAALGARGARTVLSTVGVLQQTLIGNACASIAAGDIETAMVVGGDAGYRLLRARIAGIELADPSNDAPPDRLLAPKEELRHPAELRAGLRMPVGLYAMMETAFRARRGIAVGAQRDAVAALYSRFSAIAADNPEAWTRKPITADFIRNVSDRNPMQAFPYTKLLCSSWNVDQAAALLFCSREKAEALGVPRERWIYPWASTESNHMIPVCARAELDACIGARIAGEAAIGPFGLKGADIDLIELYSCFPVAEQAYATALGVDLTRDLTVTGGMPFAGGPYNNYVLQATARMATLLRAGRGRTGLVSSVSGTLTKQGFGLWSAAPAEGGFRFVDVSDAVARVSAVRPVAMDYQGRARIAGYTVVYDPGQPPRGVAIVDTADGARAVVTTDDARLIARMRTEELCGVDTEVHHGRFAPAA